MEGKMVWTTDKVYLPPTSFENEFNSILAELREARAKANAQLDLLTQALTLAQTEVESMQKDMDEYEEEMGLGGRRYQWWRR
jgi:hypothetical protein